MKVIEFNTKRFLELSKDRKKLIENNPNLDYTVIMKDPIHKEWKPYHTLLIRELHWRKRNDYIELMNEFIMGTIDVYTFFDKYEDIYDLIDYSKFVQDLEAGLDFQMTLRSSEDFSSLIDDLNGTMGNFEPGLEGFVYNGYQFSLEGLKKFVKDIALVEIQNYIKKETILFYQEILEHEIIYRNRFKYIKLIEKYRKSENYINNEIEMYSFYLDFSYIYEQEFEDLENHLLVEYKNSSLKYLNLEDVKKEIQDLYPSSQIEFLINPHSKRDKFCFLLEEFYRLCSFDTLYNLTPNENKALLSKTENLYSEIKKYDFNNFLINRSFTILKTISLLFFIITIAASLQK